MTITFDHDGNITGPEYQPLADVLELIQGARPWTRADYLQRVRDLVADGVEYADRHLAALVAVIGDSGQGREFEQGILAEPDFSNEEIAGITEFGERL